MQRSAGNAAACLMIERSVAAAPDARRAPPLPFAELARAAAEDAPMRNEPRSTQRAPQPGPVAQRAATLASHAATVAGRVGTGRPARLAGALGGAAKHASTAVGRVARSVVAPGTARPLTASPQEIVAAPSPVEAGLQFAMAAPTDPPPAPAGAPATPKRTRVPASAGGAVVIGTPFGRLTARSPEDAVTATPVQRAPAGIQRAPGSVTAVTPSQTELGVGRRMTVQATVTGSGNPTWSLGGAPPGVTVRPAGRRATIVSAAPVPGSPVGGTNFTVSAAFPPAVAVVSAPILLVEVTGATITPAPAFGGPFATAIGTATAPPNPPANVDPNAGGVTGNTGVIVPTTLPAGRVVNAAARGKPGVGVAGLAITPGGATGTQKLRLTEAATGTFLDTPLVINSRPTRVSGFGAQTSGMPGQYGGWNTVLFGASDASGAGSRAIAEIITVRKDDFGFGAPTGGAGAPSLAFSAPANNWTDLNGTPVAAGGGTGVDVNRFVGPGVPQLPRQILYRQQFFWMSWTGTFATTALDTGTHRRTLQKAGAAFQFKTEQFFPGGAAPPMIDAYSGPPLSVLTPITFTPATLPADGAATSVATVGPGGAGRTLNWSIASGGSSVALTSGAAATPATFTAKAKGGTATIKVADSVFPNRQATGSIRLAPVTLGGISAPRNVGAGKNTATVSLSASPAGRVVDFTASAGATAGPPAVAGKVHRVVLTRTPGFTGVVTVTATDHVLTTKTATARIRFN